mgnify:FL=1
MANKYSGLVGKIMKESAEEGADFVKQNASKLLIKNSRHGKRLDNLYTGKKINGFTVGAAALGVGALMTGGLQNMTGEKAVTQNGTGDLKSIFDINSTLSVRANLTMAEQAVNPSMSADGTAGVASSKAPTLNANGNMVFGMHNLRNGKK